MQWFTIFALCMIGSALAAAFIIWMLRRAKGDPFMRRDDSRIETVILALSQRQLEALQPLRLELRFLEWVPQSEFTELYGMRVKEYVLTDAEFSVFFGVVSKRVKVLIAEAAKRQDAFLQGEAFTLSELMIGLAPIMAERHPESVAIMNARNGVIALSPELH